MSSARPPSLRSDQDLFLSNEGTHGHLYEHLGAHPREGGTPFAVGAPDARAVLDETVYAEHPDVTTIAEESTSWPMVSRPTYLGGLGFGLKWDMGWMHDTRRFLQRDLDANDADDSVLSSLRLGEPGTRPVLVVLSFTPIVRCGYELGVPVPGAWTETLNTDAGGSGVGNLGAVDARPRPMHGQPCSASITLPPLAAVWLRAPAEVSGE